MNVIIVDNNSSNLSQAKSSIPGKVTTVLMDVSKIEDFESLKAKVAKEHGGQKCHTYSPLLKDNHLKTSQDLSTYSSLTPESA